MDNNIITLIGKIGNTKEMVYRYDNEKFYSYELSCKRLNENYDVINIVISEYLIIEELFGKHVMISGSIRTYNDKNNGRTKLLVYVFVNHIEVLPDDDKNNMDSVKLNGFICTDPTFRKTPSGREISDIIIAVNRSYGKTDYIPCIFWGRNAETVKNFEPGDNIELNGRLQSRQYVKNNEIHTAYEVSAKTIKLI